MPKSERINVQTSSQGAKGVNHMSECPAIRARKEVITGLYRAARPTAQVDDEIEGTVEELEEAFSVLKGIVNEYRDGGDQMIEECTCGRHNLNLRPKIVSSEHTIEVPIPWNLSPSELILNGAAFGASTDETMSWLLDQVSWEDEEELVNILLGAMVLYFHSSWRLGECLRTAIIWSRG